MSKRKAITIGVAAYLTAIVLPFVILVVLGLLDAVQANYFHLDAVRMAYKAYSSSQSALRVLLFFDHVLYAVKVSAYVTVVAGVPFGLYLAIVHMLCGNPSRELEPPPIQDFEP